MSKASTQLAKIVTPPTGRGNTEAISKRVFKVVMQAAWTARRNSEALTKSPDFAPPTRLYYTSDDGWEAPLWHYPAALGTVGEPVILAHGLVTGVMGFDYAKEHSLARVLSQAGYSVYALEHRGDRHAIAPKLPQPFDMDDIVTQDVAAALSRVKDHSGHPRALWIGHSLGGQLLISHLAREGGRHISAGILVCAPVRFNVPRSTARLVAMAAQLLPKDWSLPTRRIQQALTPLGLDGISNALANQVDGPSRRGLWMHDTQNLQSGVIRHLATCIRSGALVDREDRIDYLTAMRHSQVPLMAIAAEGDPACPPSAARPVLEHLPDHAKEWIQLDHQWSHLDPLMCTEAAETLYPRILTWLERWRSTCWAE